MIVTAELPLLASAIALALMTLVLALPTRTARWKGLVALALGSLGTLAPLLLYPLRAPAQETARALWEWSAAGGPTVQASYRFDGVAAIGVAAVVGYTAAALLLVSRSATRHQMLPGLVLAIGLVAIAASVADDLVAATAVLGVLAALTAFAELVVAPAPASARLAAFFAAGTQCFVVAALLISRFGAATFEFADIRPTALSPGVILVASLGGALFAGLYPFVPWRYEGARDGAREREPLRGIIAVPVGLAATLVLLRLLGTSRIELSELALPQLELVVRGAIVLASTLIFALVVARRRGRGRGVGLVTATVIATALLYPWLHWSHVVLASALVTVLYAAAVSLARVDEWEVVRYDVALAALWIGCACGTPIAIAAGLFVIAADAIASLAASVWAPPHRRYIVSVAAATAFVGGVLGIAVGAASVTDPATKVLAIGALGGVLVLYLTHVARELSEVQIPSGLDVTAALASFLGSLFVALVLIGPLSDALRDALGRPLDAGPAFAPLAAPAIAVTATLLVALARALRPFVPDLTPAVEALRSASILADPVPAAIAGFDVLEATATRASAVFGVFERRAGVWLATLLIVGLLFWAVR